MLWPHTTWARDRADRGLADAGVRGATSGRQPRSQNQTTSILTPTPWIANATTEGTSITVAIPPIFGAYGTFYVPDHPDVSTVEHERAVVNVLAENTPDQPWWLGFLETGAHDIVFDDAPRVHLYADWP